MARINIYVRDPQLAARCRMLGIDISATCATALQQAVKARLVPTLLDIWMARARCGSIG